MIRRTDQIVPGWYETKLVKGGPLVGARIAFMPPDDPITGEPMDRSYRYRLWIGGREIIDDGQPTQRDPETNKIVRVGFLDRLWNIALTGNPVEEHRYHHLVAVHEWEVEHRPDLPAASPRAAVELSRIKPLF